MIRLCSPAESWHRFAGREDCRRRETLALVYGLVLDAVHPGNLGPLPPAPDVLVWKAQQIGLITAADLR